MGNEIEGVFLGGVNVFNYEKTDVKYDKKGKEIFCVWMKGGAYAEYYEQKEQPVISYYAKDKRTGLKHPITKATFDSQKTNKDNSEYEFYKVEENHPLLFSVKTSERNGKNHYEHTIDGFEGIKFYGSPNPDGIYVSNTKGAEIIADNDTERDGVNIMQNCKNVKYQINEAFDSISRWVGYKKGEGYYPNFKDK